MKSIILATVAIALVVPACAKQEQPTAPTIDDRGLSTLTAGEYVMDKTHGYVTFSYSHLGFSNPVIRFNDVNAVVSLDASDITASTLMVDIDPASIDTGVEKFDAHMVGTDFFNVAEHPKITFKSTGIVLDTAYSGTMTGDLTIKGITKPITLDVTLNLAGSHPFTGAEMFGIAATGTLIRSEFDVGGYAPAVGDEVAIRIDAEFGKK